MNRFYKNLAVEISIIIVTIVVLYGGVIFFKSKISSGANEIIKTRQDLTYRTESLQVYSLLKTQYDSKSKNYLIKLRNLVTTEDQLINLRREFQALAAKESVNANVALFPNDETILPNGLGTIKFNLNLNGDFNQIMNFIKSLDQFRYLVVIDGLSINQQGSSVQMMIQGQVYFRPNPNPNG